MKKQINYEKALLDPASTFAGPEEVLERVDLTKEQKIEILRRWEYDAGEIAVAEEEGMTGDRPLMLRRVLLALEGLAGETATAHTVPTKQNSG